jgi:hypothetical protein
VLGSKPVGTRTVGPDGSTISIEGAGRGAIPSRSTTRTGKKTGAASVVNVKSSLLAGRPGHYYFVASGRNCTRSPDSTSSFPYNGLRNSGLSLTAPQQRDSGTDLHDLSAVDPRLARLCAAWTSLPEHVVLAILALIDSAGVVEADRLKPPS